ncbi:uncharacterized protein K460DRAFT_361174 [Cucurbitaria berberidis CBS 394.84]|uniref:Uncharacterized protein n=1 Tax=Cucurbitaria berberidis CBS 394.84 TaxID=1168544 RepID=A0A9P4GSA7_9PLEO|nr:uncharacterized protein K460DRAFT_361174 [Cucurbitaria berberidis CBS 394.84]KAF1850374.1 hypothetical protein K460DRAFT_361174 [Cucurbitaria berberidis CBS 394.84]
MGSSIEISVLGADGRLETITKEPDGITQEWESIAAGDLRNSIMFLSSIGTLALPGTWNLAALGLRGI